MKTQDQYLQYVQWSEDDQAYVGYCPDLFPAGGVCHAESSIEAFKLLTDIVEDTVSTAKEEGVNLPAPATRPMREAIPA